MQNNNTTIKETVLIPAETNLIKESRVIVTGQLTSLQRNSSKFWERDKVLEKPLFSSNTGPVCCIDVENQMDNVLYMFTQLPYSLNVDTMPWSDGEKATWMFSRERACPVLTVFLFWRNSCKPGCQPNRTHFSLFTLFMPINQNSKPFHLWFHLIDQEN